MAKPKVTKKGQSAQLPAAKMPKPQTAKTIREVTDFVINLSENTRERDNFLRDARKYLDESSLSKKSKEILGALNEKAIMGALVTPDLHLVVYTFVDVDVTGFVIVSPVSFVLVFPVTKE